MFRIMKGFTLIEFLIVVLIIAIFTGVVFSIVANSSNNKNQDKKQKMTVATVQQGLEQYFLDNNATYPAATDAATMKNILVDAKLLSNTVDVTSLTYKHTTAPEGYTLSFILKNQGDSGENISGTAPNKTYSVVAQQQ